MPEAKRILIVDDEEVVLTSLTKLLLISGFQVKAVIDATEVLTAVKSFKPQLILLDLLMPKIGGLEVCDMLNKDKDCQEIPIVILSAFGAYGDINKAYKLGVVGYVTKPYEFPVLLKEINKAISHKDGE